MAARIGEDHWRADRANRSADARINERVRNQPLEQAAADTRRALELGQRLFWEPSMPLPISLRTKIGDLTEPPKSKSKDGIHPHNPDVLVHELEKTTAGCDVLLRSWRELAERIGVDQFWTSTDAFKMVRLMGKLALHMAEDCHVAQVFLCSLVLTRLRKVEFQPATFDWTVALFKMFCSYDAEEPTGVARMVLTQSEPFARRLDEMPLATLAPGSVDEGRRLLLRVIERHRQRLLGLRFMREQTEADSQAEAADRLTNDAGPEGERHRRYCDAAARKFNKSVELFLRIRTAVIAGKFGPSDFDFGDPELEETCRQIDETAEKPDRAAGEERWLSAVAESLSSGEQVGEKRRGDAPIRDVFDARLESTSDLGEISYDDEMFLRNEANEELVSCQSSVVSGPSSVVSGPSSVVDGAVEVAAEVTTEGAAPDANGVDTPSSGPSGHLLPAWGEGDMTSEAELGANGLGAGGEEASARAEGWVDTGLNEGIDLEQAREFYAPLLEKVRREREEHLRQLNEQARREMEVRRAFRRVEHAEPTSHKPLVNAGQHEDEPAMSEDKQFERSRPEVGSLTKPLVPGLGCPVPPAEGPAP